MRGGMLVVWCVEVGWWCWGQLLRCHGVQKNNHCTTRQGINALVFYDHPISGRKLIAGTFGGMVRDRLSFVKRRRGGRLPQPILLCSVKEMEPERLDMQIHPLRVASRQLSTIVFNKYLWII